jgi:Fe-S oxidoreductase
MWFDDRPADRIGRGRIEEVLASGAHTVAVGCPFCLMMVNDGLKTAGSEAQVRDIAEILADSLGIGETA